MDRTTFAGLTRLEPLEPLSTDDYSFQSVNPTIIDRLLQVGAVTHRHDAHARLENPEHAPSATAYPVGGTIPSDTSIEFAYTTLDIDGGETAASPVGSVTTRSKIEPPEEPPTLVADYTAGSLPPGVYYYGVTFTDGGGGETTMGAIGSVNVDYGYANARVLVSGLTTGMATASATGWRLYKSTGGSDFSFCGSGSIDTFEDTAACVDGLQPPPQINTTQRFSSVDVTIPVAQFAAGVVGWKLYATVTSGSFETNSLVGSGSPSDILVTLTNYSPTFGKPPSVNLSIPGASRIDLETDIANWHWRRPVATQGDLSTGTLGDVKLVTGTGQIWGVLEASAGAASAWTLLASSGTGGGGAATGSDIHIGGSAGVPTIIDNEYIEFRASGSASVAIEDMGGGSAAVLIGTSPYPRQGIDVGGSAGVPTIYRRDYVEFVGSAGGIVGVQDMGFGSARVVISASGAQGPTGAQGTAGAQGAAGTPGDGTITRVTGSAISAAIVTPVRHLEFGGSGGVKVGVEDLGGGSARVAVGSPPIVTVLPSNPHPGQEVNFQASGGASAAVWNLRYNPDAFSTHKWEFMGGGPLYAQITTDETFTESANYVDPATPGPQIRLPLAGDYEYHYQADMFVNSPGANGVVNAGLSFDGVNPVVPDLSIIQVTTTVPGAQENKRSGIIGGQPANRLITLKYQVGTAVGGTPHTRWRSLMLRPVRVSG